MLQNGIVQDKEVLTLSVNLRNRVQACVEVSQNAVVIVNIRHARVVVI